MPLSAQRPLTAHRRSPRFSMGDSPLGQVGEPSSFAVPASQRAAALPASLATLSMRLRRWTTFSCDGSCQPHSLHSIHNTPERRSHSRMLRAAWPCVDW